MIFFDIETAPLMASEMNERMPTFKPRANLKDEAKIEADIKEKREKFFDDAALSPFTGRVCAYGYASGEDKKVTLVHYNGREEDEKAILTKFWNLYVNTEDTFVGFNINNFDLPFLIRRSYVHDLTMPRDIYNPVYRRYGSRFIDMMDYWRLTNHQERISLSNFAVHVGLTPKEENGAFFHEWIKGNEDDVKKAEDYLTNDVELKRSVYQRIGLAA